MRYHTNGRGESDICDAPEGRCPLEGDHFDTREEADAAFEQKNNEQLFAPQGKLLTNRLDDAYNTPEVDPIAVSRTKMTMPEEIAIDEQKMIEKDIAQHKKAVANGYSPFELTNLSEPTGLAKSNGDPDAIVRAWHQKDYDKVRELYATAHARQFGRDPDFRLSVSELTARARS